MLTTPPLDLSDGKKSRAEAHTGGGGNASGGSVEGEDGLINLLSGAQPYTLPADGA
jgi:hypothetical protein